MNNLQKQGFVNIQRDCIPIEVKFPRVDSDKFSEEFGQVLTKISRNLLHARIIDMSGLKHVLEQINKDILSISVKEILYEGCEGSVELIEAGFDYVTERDGAKIYRKRK